MQSPDLRRQRSHPLTLKGKVAIITGAGSGIGHATALKFAREGARVVVADLNLEAAQAVVAEIEAAGSPATRSRSRSTCRRGVDAGSSPRRWIAFEVIDVLFNNAGIGGGQPCSSTTPTSTTTR